VLRPARLVFLVAGVGLGIAVGYGIRYAQESSGEEEFIPAVIESHTPSSFRPRAKPAHPVSTDWRSAEQSLRALKPSAAEWFLKKTRIPDFFSELQKSEPLQLRAPRLEGCFFGDVHLTDGQVWQMKTEISLQEGSPPSGTVSVQLSENGKLFNNSSATGEVRDLKSFGMHSEAVILEASDTRYFQIYSMADPTTLLGNLYVRESDPVLKFKGSVILKKGTCSDV
jgi:hypothetical protein